MADRPTYTVEIGFAAGVSDSEASVTWTAVSGVLAIAIERGRQDQLARFEAGTCTVVLDNASGDFSPENAAGTYYPNVVPMKRLRVKARHDALSAYAIPRGLGSTDAANQVTLFYGFIQRWVPNPSVDEPTVTIEAIDLFTRMAALELNQAVSEQLTGARLGAVLDALGWSASDRDLDAGKSTVAAVTLSETSALQHVQDVIEVEDGQFWIAGDGRPTFRDRHARLTDTVSTTSQATFGGASGLPIVSYGDYSSEVDQISNELRVKRTGGTEQTASDTTSQNAYGKRTLRRNSDHLLDDGEAQSLALWLLIQHKDPVPRLRSITVEGGASDTLWEHMLSRTINDRITVVRTFPGSFGLNRDFWIEGVRHEITAGLTRHRVEWLISTANVPTWFVIGHATLGKIGTGRIAY